MLLSDTHLTPVLGIDIHFTSLPPFNPFHPYIGIVLDPMDYIPFIGTNVHINGFKRGVSDTSGIIITLFHIPLFTPPWRLAPIIGHQSMNFFASKRVFADGTRLSPKGHMLMTCNDIGIPLSLAPGAKKFWKLVPTLFAPTSYSLPIPHGPRVNVGGPYPPDWKGILTGLLMSFGFGAILKGTGKILKKAITKFNLARKAKMGSNRLSDLLCKYGFEPVNLVTGAVDYRGTDFTLAGMLPLEWNRAWYSDSSYQGPLGYGVHGNYDLDVEIFPGEEFIAVRAEDGRALTFPLLEEEEEFYNREEKLTLKRHSSSFEIYNHVSRKKYYYNHSVSAQQYRLSRIENESGFGLAFTYRADVLSEITDSAGRKIEIHSVEGKIVKVSLLTEKREEETLVSYTYDERGNMIGITDSLGKTTRIEYKNHLMVKKTDRNGQAFYWEYDGEESGSRCIHTWGDGGLQEGWLVYYPQEGCNKITDAQRRTTEYYYTPDQLVTRIKDPMGNSKHYEYTEYKELYRETDEEGHMTGYSYDEAGNLIAITYADGSEQLYMYDEEGHLTLSISPDGQKQIYVYDEDSHLLHSIIEPDNSFTVFEYNKKNLPVEIRKSSGDALYLEYDVQHNLCSLTDKEGNTTEWGYDYRGNVTRIKTATGLTQYFHYDPLDRVTSVQTPQGRTRFRYNAYEEIVEATEDHRRVNFQYSPLGSLLMREENGIKVCFAYNKMEQLQEIKNEKSERYLFYRDSRGDIRQETGFDGTSTHYGRDRCGKIIQVHHPGGKSTEYEYDLKGQVIRAEHSDGSWETYDYNKDGQLVEARNQDNCIILKRDGVGRVVEEIQSSGLPDDEGHSIQSTYDERSGRIEISSSLGAKITTTYDKQGNLLGIEARQESGEDSPQESWQAQITRNQLGQEIERALSGGVRLTTRYDEYGHPVEQQVRSGARETYHRQYRWSPTEKLTQIVNGLTHAKTAFTYDSFGSLLSAQYEDGSYDYKFPDAVGNLYKTEDKKDCIYGAGSKLLKDKNWNYLYDAAGNLQLKTRRKLVHNPDAGSDPTFSFLMEEEGKTTSKNFWKEVKQMDARAEIRHYSRAERKAYDRLRQQREESLSKEESWALGDWEYHWQGNGMLKSVRTPTGEWIHYEYDALGRRTAKLIGDKIYRYLWDGNTLLHEWHYPKSARPKIETDELGWPKPDNPEPVENLTTWVYEEGSLVPVAKLTNGEKYSIIADYIGRPAQAYDEKGKIVWEAEYDIYGNIRKQSGIKDKDFVPFRQLGQYEDEETGLFYNRFRYYNPESGQYISQDPIGLAGNNPNLYAYVSDVNLEVDPFGLRIPRTNGSWDGVPGNSNWFSNNPKVTRITGGEGIPFKDGLPNFDKWSQNDFKIDNMTGGRKDFDLVHQYLKDRGGLKSKEDARKFLRQNGLTAHHHPDMQTIQLIPSDLHNNVPHVGGASKLRKINCH